MRAKRQQSTLIMSNKRRIYRVLAHCQMHSVIFMQNMYMLQIRPGFWQKWLRQKHMFNKQNSIREEPSLVLQCAKTFSLLLEPFAKTFSFLLFLLHLNCLLKTFSLSSRSANCTRGMRPMMLRPLMPLRSVERYLEVPLIWNTTCKVG